MKKFGILEDDPIGPGVNDERSAVGVGKEAERFSTKGRLRLYIVSVERNGV